MYNFIQGCRLRSGLPPSMEMTLVLQQAPAQAIVWGYTPNCDSKLSLMFDGKMMEPTSFTGEQYMELAALPFTVQTAPFFFVCLFFSQENDESKQIIGEHKI